MLFVAISSGGGTISISGTCGDAGGSQIDAEVKNKDLATTSHNTGSDQSSGAFDFQPINAPGGGSPYRVTVTVRATGEESVTDGVWVLGYGKKGRPQATVTEPDLYASGVTVTAGETVTIRFQSANPKENNVTSGGNKKFPTDAEKDMARHNKENGNNVVHIKAKHGRPYNKNFQKP